jgi:hypothetical protein
VEEGGFNLYAYCGNDPVNRHDPFGCEQVFTGSELTSTLLSIADPLNYIATGNGFAERTGFSLGGGAPNLGDDMRCAAITQGGLGTSISLWGDGLRAIGGVSEMAIGILGEGVSGAASTFFVLNGADNFWAATTSLATGESQASLGERAVYSIAGDGFAGSAIYLGTQIGTPLALNRIGARGTGMVGRVGSSPLSTLNPLNYDWRPLTGFDSMLAGRMGMNWWPGLPKYAGTRQILAARLQWRAAQLQSMRLGRMKQWGTTSAVQVRNKLTGEDRVLISTEGRAIPVEFSGRLTPDESFVEGIGHAEQTILAELGPEWEILAGGTSRNICTDICWKELKSFGLKIGGPRFDGFADKTPYRMFWLPELE